MTPREDFLFELLTEEWPPKTLFAQATAFCQHLTIQLQDVHLAFDEITFFVTPRRLAVLIKQLVAVQPDQIIERKGPALTAAVDAKGQASKAAIGFARSCGVDVTDLMTIKNEQGEWLGFRQAVKGKSVADIMPPAISKALEALSIPKRMRWGSHETSFVRPVHGVVLLYGDQVIDATLLGQRSHAVTHGHRFHAPEAITIPHASAYAALLETEGHVIADFVKRRDRIQRDAALIVKKTLGESAHVLISSDEFLDEVTGLVEWPEALCGRFDVDFLALPRAVLISAMQDHQRYFPVIDGQGKLLPHFVVISNIHSRDPKRVIHGNERVLRARLSDAAFFYETDKKERLDHRLERLKNSVFQAGLGTLYDKAERLSQLTAFIAKKMDVSAEYALRAGLLSKTDLATNMVSEFPELQGVIGGDYARHDGEPEVVAQAIAEHYFPRFSGDRLPDSRLGQALAIADRLDTLMGCFGLHHVPTGDKDPYGLRRASLGVLRILIEKSIDLDLKEVLEVARVGYGDRLKYPDAITLVLTFMQERLRAWSLEQGVTADVFASVAAVSMTNPCDVQARIQAVQAFKKLNEAAVLAVAHKRVNNILTQYGDAIEAKSINPDFFEHDAETVLARQLEAKRKAISPLQAARNYREVLLELAQLRQPIDDFFDHVMVMTDDKRRRENRLLLLSQLRALFLEVADIALLQ